MSKQLAQLYEDPVLIERFNKRKINGVLLQKYKLAVGNSIEADLVPHLLFGFRGCPRIELYIVLVAINMYIVGVEFV
jgi:hypothetical protein